MFADLLNNPQGQVFPPKLQSEAAKKFPDVVDKSNLKIVKPGCPLRDNSFVIIGVASYSPLELSLLDTINDNFDHWNSNGNIYVFDVLSCADQSDLERFFVEPFLTTFWSPLFAYPRPFHPFPVTLEQTPLLLVAGARMKISFQQGLENAKNVLMAWGAIK